MIGAALFAALSAVLSQVAIPLGAVPIVLTQVSVFLAAALLGWKWGALSQLLFLAMGAAGLPVFAKFGGGIEKLFGPTGGFLLGYVLAALVVGLLVKRFGSGIRVLIPILLLGALVIYLPGVPWLMHVLRLDLAKGLTAGFLPYLPGDCLKVLLCALLIPRLQKVLPLPGKTA
jgi:biotin transport system substrate-specific component